jgi:hypothetical protein
MESYPISCFSKTQLDKSENKRKCKNCVKNKNNSSSNSNGNNENNDRKDKKNLLDFIPQHCIC